MLNFTGYITLMLSSFALSKAYQHCRSLFFTLLMVSCFILTASICSAFSFDVSHDSKALLLGYGQSIPGWGQTTERVQTIDLIPRYDHVIFSDIGSGWWRGQYSTLIEVPIHIVCSPVVSSMVGINFLASYKFTDNKQWRPYIFGGGGPVYSFADIPGMGAEWNGNYQFALGLDHPINPTQSVLFEIRYDHISNGGSADPNVPLNSVKFLFGLTF